MNVKRPLGLKPHPKPIAGIHHQEKQRGIEPAAGGTGQRCARAIATHQQTNSRSQNKAGDRAHTLTKLKGKGLEGHFFYIYCASPATTKSIHTRSFAGRCRFGGYSSQVVPA